MADRAEARVVREAPEVAVAAPVAAAVRVAPVGRAEAAADAAEVRAAAVAVVDAGVIRNSRIASSRYAASPK